MWQLAICYPSPVPKFDYTALDPAGARVRGVLSGPSEQAVLAELDARRLTPVAIAPQRERAASAAGLRPRPLGQAYKQLADLLRAGVPLLRGLRLLGGRKSAPRIAIAFADLADRVAAGEDLAKAMAERPDAFPPVHVAMIRAGERGGFLGKVLDRLAQMVTAQAELRGKILASLTYPAVLVVLGSAMITGVFAFFVPQFRAILSDSRAPLPPLTRLLFAASDFMGRFWPLLVLLLAAGIVFALSALRSPALRERLDILRTRLPVLGPLAKSLAAARFCRMLGTMMDNGVPLLAGMQIAKDAAGNVLMERAIAKAVESVRAGQPLAPPLAESGMFDEDVIEMIAVAETANNLGEVLLTIADTTESRVDRLLAAAVKLIEPLLLIFLATIVGLIAAALVIPLTQMGRNLG
jgi:general secretion pathway protein F/type IV pilus assembly protein PilC